MGGSDKGSNAAFSHLVLVATSSLGLSQINNAGQNFTYPGMHANFFIHGVIGFLHNQNIVDINCSTAYSISLLATRYLTLPSLMADLWNSNKALSAIHLISGVLPFTIAVAAKDNVPLGQWVITCNLISLVFYAFDKNLEWGWYAAGSAFISYFLVRQTSQAKMLYPVGLAVLEYCVYRLSAPAGGGARSAGRPAGNKAPADTVDINCSKVYNISLLATRYLTLPCLMADLWNSNKALSAIHLLSGVIPFGIAVVGKDSVQLGQWCITCNFISLIFYSFDIDRDWGWYAAGSAFMSYFLVRQTKYAKMLYPVGLALLEYCVYRLPMASAGAGGSGAAGRAARR